MKRLINILFIITLGLLTFRCGDGIFNSGGSNNDVSADSTFFRTFDKSGITSISVKGINGAIEVRGTETDSILIEARLRVQAPTIESVREGIDLIKVRFSFSGGGQLQIDSVLPQNDSRNFQVSFILTVPKEIPIFTVTTNGVIVLDSLNASIEMSTTNGAVSAKNVKGDVVANTTNGAILLENIQGSVSVQTTNGAIGAQNISPNQGFVDMQTTNGAITLTVPVSISATISARTTNGTVSISNLNIELTINEPNHKKGKIGEGKATITLVATNGNIEISGN